MYCNNADGFARKEDSLSNSNSEILDLKSTIAAARIAVNPVKRGQKYGALSVKFASEAVKLDDTNPRAHYVKARAILHTPPAFGGGEKKAKPVFELALMKFKIVKPESNLHPSCGKEAAEKELLKLTKK